MQRHFYSKPSYKIKLCTTINQLNENIAPVTSREMAIFVSGNDDLCRGLVMNAKEKP
jgi:hypothetical protein